jgi:hypothetical protein
MTHRLRLAMSLSPAAGKWSGGVVVSVPPISETPHSRSPKFLS